MKTTTKLITAILAIAMLFSLAACQSKAPVETKTPDNSPEVQEPDNSPEAAKFDTATEGVLTMATNAAFPPYEYLEGDVVKGIDAEVAEAIAKKLGLELKINDMDFDASIIAVQEGKADVALAGMTVTDERKEKVNFSESYATGVQVVIVKEDSPITSVDDLFADGANNTIGVQRNTTGDIYTTGDIEQKGLGTIDRYSRGAEAVMALTTGKIDCVVIDNEPAKAFVAANEGLKILETEYITENYAIAMNKENTALFDAVNDALKELIADGTVAAIIEKYIPTEG